MLCNDADLIDFEPTLFRDVRWASQRLVHAVGDVEDWTLTLTSTDVDLEAADIGAGHVVNVNDVSYPVIDRIDDLHVAIRRPGGSPPSPATAAAIRIYTFEPQIRSASAMLLAPLDLDEHEIVNRDQVRMLISLFSLHLVFSAAAVMSGDDGLHRRASLYASRTDAFRQRVPVRTIDDTRPLATTTLQRG